MAELDRCDLLGVGSGIFGMAFHPRLRRFAEDLPGRPARREVVLVLDEREA